MQLKVARGEHGDLRIVIADRTLVVV